jgi:hypothetical protein
VADGPGTPTGCPARRTCRGPPPGGAGSRRRPPRGGRASRRCRPGCLAGALRPVPAGAGPSGSSPCPPSSPVPSPSPASCPPRRSGRPGSPPIASTCPRRNGKPCGGWSPGASRLSRTPGRHPAGRGAVQPRRRAVPRGRGVLGCAVLGEREPGPFLGPAGGFRAVGRAGRVRSAAHQQPAPLRLLAGRRRRRLPRALRHPGPGTARGQPPGSTPSPRWSTPRSCRTSGGARRS